ncbi:myo-inosose-2 dehydratase [Oceanicola sp. S124]|uniref:myo-inosose-2 dehydratase n=1 Tax=Oceanicola sp. S124 TaxID=1042378 RepID=UPI0002558D35|nr:myo-inosose-2 dehydratase [Oceanicola sp. S124]
MAIRIGISPISWQNDDLPELTAQYTMDQALREARGIGYRGVERGRQMPEGTEALRGYLDQHDLALCGGWCSGNLLVNDVETEWQAIRGQVAQFAALDAPCIVYSECSNTVQGDIGVPVNDRPRLGREGVRAYARKLSELAKRVAGAGTVLSYHHHMGSIIEAEEEVDWLMAASGPEVTLCFDTGHLLFGGGDVLATLDRWAERVHHVHFKDIRPGVVRDVRDNRRSFLEAVIAGAFTVPGDGCIDFQAVADRLKAMGYDGWIVVEAEQDPASAPPEAYARMGYETILQVCARAGLQVTRLEEGRV